MHLILFRWPKKSWTFFEGRIEKWANLSRISLSSDSIANSSLKKGLIIIVEPHICWAPKGQAKVVECHLVRPIVGRHHFVHSLDEFIGRNGIFVLLPQNLGSLVCCTVRASETSIRTLNDLRLLNWNIVDWLINGINRRLIDRILYWRSILVILRSRQRQGWHKIVLWISHVESDFTHKALHSDKNYCSEKNNNLLWIVLRRTESLVCLINVVW